MLVSLDKCLSCWFSARPSLKFIRVDSLSMRYFSGKYYVNVLVSIRGRARFYYQFIYSYHDIFDSDLQLIKIV